MTHCMIVCLCVCRIVNTLAKIPCLGLDRVTESQRVSEEPHTGYMDRKRRTK